MHAYAYTCIHTHTHMHMSAPAHTRTHAHGLLPLPFIRVTISGVNVYVLDFPVIYFFKLNDTGGICMIPLGQQAYCDPKRQFFKSERVLHLLQRRQLML